MDEGERIPTEEQQESKTSLRRRPTTVSLATIKRKCDEGILPRLLPDPLDDRVVKDVPRPAAELLVASAYWDDQGLPRLDVLEQHLSAEGMLEQELMRDVILRAQEKFMEESNLLDVSDPVTVVGDIHGQYYDLRTLVEVGGNVTNTQYLFLGDYVDRGSFSVEVLTYLFSVKLTYPDRIHMLRGNHESRQMTNYFNFREECEFKYDNCIYDTIMDTFDALPIAALINRQYLVLHGGLSPHLQDVSQILACDRLQEPPREGLICDLLWSDPTDADRVDDFTPNRVRGCAWSFSMDYTSKFLSDNKLLCVFRAHEVQQEGFKFHKLNPKTQMPAVITVFSAPNYCDAYGNRGAVLRLENDTLNLKQYNFRQHPYHLTNMMTLFDWSFPFVAEQVLFVLETILAHTDESADGTNNTVDTEAKVNLASDRAGRRKKRPSLTTDENRAVCFAMELSDALRKNLPEGWEDEFRPEADEDHRTRMRQKVRIVTRMMMECKKAVEQRRNLMNIGSAPDRLDIPQLIEAKEKARDDSELFGAALNLDTDNEKRPAGGDNNMVTPTFSCKGVESKPSSSVTFQCRGLPPEQTGKSDKSSEGENAVAPTSSPSTKSATFRCSSGPAENGIIDRE